MLHLLISIIGIILTICFVVGTHEFAHFITARWLGIKVLRFSIGFGKTLFKWRDRKQTEYVVALIPLGGYVKMLDENEGDVPPEELHQAFNRQPFYKKFLVVLAGPTMNLLCALFLYWLIFIIGFSTIKPIIGNITPHSIAAKSGLKANHEIVSIDDKKVLSWTGVIFRLLAHIGDQDQIKIGVSNLSKTQQQFYQLDTTYWQLGGLTPDPLSSLGIVPYTPTIPLVVGQLAADSPAKNSPLRIGDSIISVNQQPIKNWNELISIIAKHPDETVTFTVKRNHQRLTFPVTLGYQRGISLQKTGYLGIGPNFKLPPEYLQHIQYEPFKAFVEATEEMVNFTYFNFLLFGKLITGKLSLQSLGGPIMIFETAGDALHYGFLSFIGFLAFLSIAIGVVNLLPIPGLDGGHLLIFIIEFIRRKPLSLNVIMLLYRLGFIFILVIVIQTVANDILRLTL